MGVVMMFRAIDSGAADQADTLGEFNKRNQYCNYHE